MACWCLSRTAPRLVVLLSRYTRRGVDTTVRLGTVRSQRGWAVRAARSKRGAFHRHPQIGAKGAARKPPCPHSEVLGSGVAPFTPHARKTHEHVVRAVAVAVLISGARARDSAAESCAAGIKHGGETKHARQLNIKTMDSMAGQGYIEVVSKVGSGYVHGVGRAAEQAPRSKRGVLRLTPQSPRARGSPRRSARRTGGLRPR